MYGMLFLNPASFLKVLESSARKQLSPKYECVFFYFKSVAFSYNNQTC